MERVVFVEVLDRRGEPLHRVRLTQLPAVIGRAWSSDVILSDPHVDAQHARLDADDSGALFLEDLGSVNGLRDGNGPPVRRLVLQPSSVVRLGRTAVRFAAPDQPVPAAIPDAEPGGWLARVWSSPRAMAGIVAAALVITALSVWLGSYQKDSSGALAGVVLAIAGSVALWAGLWALAGRQILHRARFGHHLTLACLAFVTLWLTGALGSWASFFVNPDMVGVVDGLAATAVFVAALVLHAGLATAASRRRRVLFAFGVTAGLAVMAWIGDTTSRRDYGSHVTIGATLKPVPASLVPSRSLQDFLARTESIQRALDREK